MFFVTRIKHLPVSARGRAYAAIFALAALVAPLAADEVMPLIDVHVHYNEDAWSVISPGRAVELLRQAGLDRALVSSSGDAGTQRLHQLARELVVPVLRPYRGRGEQSRWMYDASVSDMLAQKIEAGNYAGIGEFHADGEQIDLPVIQHVIALARRHGMFLHAHVDVDAVERIFRADPQARVLWAHAGFEDPATIGVLMQKYPNLWADLSFREEIAFRGSLDNDWQRLFEAFPTRFMLGSDTYTPTRWFYLVEHADWARSWLADLPRAIAENIAFRNAERLLQRSR